MTEWLAKDIARVPATREPLSADVVMIRGARWLWCYDVGCGEAAFRAISQAEGAKVAVLSHFHPDHIGNWHRLTFEESFVGKQTLRYTGSGTVVTEPLRVEDGHTLRLLPMPSSHAKGSLALEADGRFLFVGDALCPRQRDGFGEYNVQLLRAQIDFLKGAEADTVGISHRADFLVPKETVLKRLETLYARREREACWIRTVSACVL